MRETKQQILILVEGAKTDAALMRHLFSVYQFDADYEIVSYCTNIYTLYHEMFEETDPSDMDLLQILKSRESDPTKQALFDVTYSDILLVFDLDPQDPDFTSEKIKRMTDYFVESSDMGKLYLNYPMVEAFYHMASIPGPNFDSYYSTLSELHAGAYKHRVNRENRNHDYRKFAVTKEECNSVITQNISKAWRLISSNASKDLPPPQSDILSAQLGSIKTDKQVAVLSTCPFFIPEYNSGLIKDVQTALE